jgi:tetratricopeptide (TPR) repeat protein
VNGAQVFIAIVVCMVLYQLYTGKTLRGRRTASVDRATQPAWYWFIIAFQVAIVSVVLVTGKTHWRFTRRSDGTWREVRQASSANRDSLRPDSDSLRTDSAAPAQPPRRQQAFDLNRAQNYSGALVIYNELLSENDADAELHYWRGIAQWHLAHEDSALADFRRVMDLEPRNFDAHRNADRLLSNERRWDEVLDVWNHYIAIDSTNAEAWYERGGTNYHKGDIAAAVADATKACQLGKADGCAQAARMKR